MKSAKIRNMQNKNSWLGSGKDHTLGLNNYIQSCKVICVSCIIYVRELTLHKSKKNSSILDSWSQAGSVSAVIITRTIRGQCQQQTWLCKRVQTTNVCQMFVEIMTSGAKEVR